MFSVYRGADTYSDHYFLTAKIVIFFDGRERNLVLSQMKRYLVYTYCRMTVLNILSILFKSAVTTSGNRQEHGNCMEG